MTHILYNLFNKFGLFLCLGGVFMSGRSIPQRLRRHVSLYFLWKNINKEIIIIMVFIDL